MLPQGIVSFKCCPIHVHPCAYANMTNERQKAKFPSLALNWEKIYKLERSIELTISADVF